MSQWRTRGNEAVLQLQKFLDARYRFIWASIGAPGNTHDSTNFQSTSLWDDIKSGKTFSGQVVEVNCVEIPPIILCGGAFPL